MDDPITTYDLSGLRAWLRRRWQVIVVITGLLAAVALVVSLLQDDRYEATATLLFRDPGLDQRIFDAPILFGGDGLLGGQNVLNSETSIGLVSVDAVAERTASELGEADSAQVSDAVEVREGAGRELIEVTAEAETPERAAAVANAYAASFVGLRRMADLRVSRRAESSVRNQLEQLPPRLRASAEGDRLRDQLRDLQALQLLRSDAAELVEEAEPPASRSAPKPLRATLLGGFTGLVLGLLAALLLERLDPRLRSRSELEHAYGAPVIDSAPSSGPGPGDGSERPARVRALWAALRYRQREAAPRSILVLAGAGGDGTATALALARAGAETGARLLLVEGDLRTPRLADELRLDPAPGLAELLGGETSLERALQESDRAADAAGAASFGVIAAGAAQGRDTSLLGAPTLVQLHERLLAGNDALTIVAPPPLDAFADLAPLVGLVDAVVVVVGDGQATRAEAAELRRWLATLGAEPSFVLVDPGPDHLDR